jgi:hypothetical protein
MATIEDDIPVRRSANDPNEGLRIRLSGRALPDPRPVAAELQGLVTQRSDPPLPGRHARRSRRSSLEIDEGRDEWAGK